jgi:hypothetical protein
MTRFFKFLPTEQRSAFLGRLSERGHELNWAKARALAARSVSSETLHQQILRRDDWRFSTRNLAATLATISKKI